MSVSIDIKKVVKRYEQNTVINDLSVHIKEGEFFTLLGPSGCGKTTLLRMIIGFNSIDEGEILVGNERINEVPTNERDMGMVFQNYAIFPHMSVRDNVAFGLTMRGKDKETIRKAVDEVLKIVKIDHLADRMPVQLSGGQQQRVALARAIVIEPKVLLMDEPLSNLDAKLRVEMRNAIKEIQRRVGITTVYVTHDQEEALAVSDRIAVMQHGVIQQCDTPTVVYRRPSNLFVASFMGLSNPIRGTVTEANDIHTIAFESGYTVSFDNLQDTVKRDMEVIVSARPEELSLHKDGDGIPVTVESRVFLGLVTHYFVALPSGQRIEVIQDYHDEELYEEGTALKMRIDSKRTNVFHSETEETLIRRVGHE